MEDLIVGLDLGSSRITCVIAAYDDQDQLEVVSLASAPSEGLRNGVIINMKAAVKAIQSAVEAAEAKGFEVRDLLCAVSGGAIEGLNSKGVVAVARGREIGPDHVAQVLEAARAVVIPLDREILHVLPQEYVVDGVPAIKNPVEMLGIRLEAEVHIVTASASALQSLIQTVNNAGFTVEEIVLESLAAASSVLSKEEKDVGVLLIDFGAGTTDAVLFLDGAPRYTRVISLGSDRITKDLAQVLQIPEDEAERLKVESGACFLPSLAEDYEVVIRAFGSRPAQARARHELAEIIQPRMEEILGMVYRDLHRLGLLDKLGGGVVLTGGGARLDGLTHLCEAIFQRNARIGTPFSRKGLAEQDQVPEYSAALGLIALREELHKREGRPGTASRRVSAGPGMFGRLVNWFKNRVM